MVGSAPTPCAPQVPKALQAKWGDPLHGPQHEGIWKFVPFMLRFFKKCTMFLLNALSIYSAVVLGMLLSWFFCYDDFAMPVLPVKWDFCGLLTWGRDGQSRLFSLVACVASGQCLCHIWMKGVGAENQLHEAGWQHWAHGCPLNSACITACALVFGELPVWS